MGLNCIEIIVIVIIVIVIVILLLNNYDTKKEDYTCEDTCNSQFGNCQGNYESSVSACSIPCDNAMCTTECQNEYRNEYRNCLSEQAKCYGDCGGYTNNDPSSISYYYCSSTPYPTPPPKASVGQSCSSDNDCQNNACGRSTAADGAPLICCPSGSTDSYATYDYCTGMPSGSTCWSGAMCSSGNCQKDCHWYDFGICKGTCS